MTNIKVGDYVVWQKPSYQSKDGRWFLPMGIRGCKVVGFLKAYDDEEKRFRDFAELEFKLPSMEESDTFHSPVDYLTVMDALALDEAS